MKTKTHKSEKLFEIKFNKKMWKKLWRKHRKAVFISAINLATIFIFVMMIALVIKLIEMFTFEAYLIAFTIGAIWLGLYSVVGIYTKKYEKK